MKRKQPRVPQVKQTMASRNRPSPKAERGGKLTKRDWIALAQFFAVIVLMAGLYYLDLSWRCK